MELEEARRAVEEHHVRYDDEAKAMRHELERQRRLAIDMEDELQRWVACASDV
jgi:hypothetical protein